MSNTEELETLLGKALESVSVQHLSDTMDLADYRLILNRRRTVYDPQAQFAISHIDFDFEDGEIRNQLLELIRSELSKHIRDDAIFSASSAFPSEVDYQITPDLSEKKGAPIERILRNLVRRAIVDGPATAAQAFYECSHRSSCTFCVFFRLDNLYIEQEMEVFNGVRLIPMPNSTSDLPPYLPTDLVGVGCQFVGGSLARVEYDVSPIFQQPEPMPDIRDWRPREEYFNSVSVKSEEVPNLDVQALWDALSLASQGAVWPSMRWTTPFDYEIFDLRKFFPSVNPLFRSRLFDRGSFLSARLKESQLESAKNLYHEIVGLSQEVRDLLRIPMDRWRKSLAVTGFDLFVDNMIDLGVAFESLYLTDGRDGLTYKFALRASWLLGQDAAHRAELFSKFKDIYNARSAAVHTGKLPDLDDDIDFIKQARKLCCQSIEAIIHNRGVPKWDRLVLGQS